jgi:peroxiredoxin
LDRVLPGNAEPTPVRSVSELAAPASGGSQGLTGAPPRVGQEAPDFSLPDLNGKLVKLSELRGQPVLINFWATWCIPCKQEMPAIDAAYQAHKDQGFTVLAIEIEEPADEVTQYVQDLKLTFTPLLDRDPRVFDRYGVRAMPSSFFIDRQGKVSAVHFGPLTNQQLEDNLQAILAGPGG